MYHNTTYFATTKNHNKTQILRFNSPRKTPVPARRPNKEAAQISPWGRAGLRRFFGFWRGEGMGRKCGLWPHADKTGGFQRGATAPLWHTALLARYSVLYLLARLTGEAGCGAVCTPLAPTGKRAGFCDREGTKSLSVFRERRQVYKPPSPVFRPPQGWDKVSRSSGAPGVRQG